MCMPGIDDEIHQIMMVKKTTRKVLQQLARFIINEIDHTDSVSS